MTECLLKEGVAGSAGVGADVEYAKYTYRSVSSKLQTMSIRNAEARGITREARFVFGLEERPVDLMPFDMCPTCRVAMKYNATMHQLVCPVTGCGQWKRFADMTASALPYGEEVEFCKYTYRPVTRLDETMKHIEGAEAFVVPSKDLERVMQVLLSRRVLLEDITLPMIREICHKLKDIKVENAVQYYCRLTGRAPRRMMPEGTKRVLIALYNQQRSLGRKNITLSQIRHICEVEGIIADVDVEEIHSWITTGTRHIPASDKDAMREMFEKL